MEINNKNLNNNPHFKAYLKSIHLYKRISKSREKQLLDIIKFNKNEEYINKAKHEFITANLGLVVHQAMKYFKGFHGSLDIMDLISVGNQALIKAIDYYQTGHSSKAKFSTFAILVISRDIEKAIKKDILILHPVEHCQYHKKIEKLKSKYGNKLTDEILVEKLQITHTFLECIKKSYQNNNIIYLENLSTSDDCQWQDIMGGQIAPNPDEALFSNSLKEFLDEYIQRLSPSHQNIIRDYYSDSEPSLLKLAEKYNLSGEMIRQININSLRKIKSQILEDLKVKYKCNFNGNVQNPKTLKAILVDFF